MESMISSELKRLENVSTLEKNILANPNTLQSINVIDILPVNVNKYLEVGHINLYDPKYLINIFILFLGLRGTSHPASAKYQLTVKYNDGTATNNILLSSIFTVPAELIPPYPPDFDPSNIYYFYDDINIDYISPEYQVIEFDAYVSLNVTLLPP
jgi:hypothetical protein